jgi:hypothetical protein
MVVFYLLFNFSLYNPPNFPKVHPVIKKWVEKGEDKVVKVWIFFTDKGIFTEEEYRNEIRKVEEELNPRCRERRLIIRKEGELCDFTDIPVYEPYLQELAVSGCQLDLTSKWLNGGTFYVKLSQIEEIAKKPWVRSIEPIRLLITKVPTMEREVKGIDYGLSRKHLELVKVDKVHAEKGFSGEGVRIGVLDTGFEWKRNRALKGIKVIKEYDFIGKDSCTAYEKEQVDTIMIGDELITVEETVGQIHHGTHMLVLLGGKYPSPSEEIGCVGVAFNAEFVLAKTELYQVEGAPIDLERNDIICEEDWWIAGVEWCEEQGVDIISNSLGYKRWYDPNDSTPNFAYKYLDGKHYRMSKVASELYKKNILLVTALGNRRSLGALPETCIVAPADADSILAVGGVNEAREWVYWDYGIGGIKGPRVDGAVKPEVCGPWIGRYMCIKYSHETDSYDTLEAKEGIGTSIATAIVAGICALVKEAYPTGTMLFVRERVIKSASLYPSHNDSLGYGIVDAFEAVGDKKTIPWDKSKILSLSPMPFSPSEHGKLTIKYQLLHNTIVDLYIYTLSGRLVWHITLPKKNEEDVPMGRPYVITWDGSDGATKKRVGTGIYLVVLRTSFSKDVKKLAVVR